VADKATRILLGKDKARQLLWGDNQHAVLIDSSTEMLGEMATFKSEVWYAQSIDVATGDVKIFFKNQPDLEASTGSIVGQVGKFYAIVNSPIQRIKVNGEYRVTAANYYLAQGYPLCLFNFRMDSAVGKLMVRGGANTDTYVVGGDGRVAALSSFDDVTKVWQLSMNQELASGKQTFKVVYSTSGETLDRPHLLGLGRDGSSVLIQTGSEADDSLEFHEVAVNGTLSGPVAGSAGLSSPLFHPVTGCLAGFRIEGDVLTDEYFDPLLKSISAAIPKMLGDDYRVSPVSFAEDPRKLIVYCESRTDPGSYYFLDLTTGAGDQIAANYPDIPEEWVAERRAIKYAAADGLTITGYLTLPPFKAEKDLPLIVLPHGGPQARDYLYFDWQAQTLAAYGYAVLQPNFRGSDGIDATFVAAGHGQWGRKMQTDLSDGVRYLAGKGIIDAKRVAILGASYGGYAAMAGATLDPGVYKCAVAIAGVSDLESMVAWEDRKTDFNHSATVLYWKRFMGDQAGWAGISPASQAAKASCPVMLIHGTDDTVVPYEQSQRMESALKAAGKPVEFLTYKGQDHWESLGSARIDMMKQALAFLDKHNPA
ncbi:MAG: S9 family peptidase, partial [Asticcacaulis sp.]|nr:S9 family peptidase [Asticcacaulis sp.]